MPLYAYQAYAPDGKKMRGTIDALSLNQAREQLVRKGWYISSLQQVNEAVSSTAWWRRIFASRVSTQDIIFFTKQLSVLLKSGVPLLDALSLLVEQTEGRLRVIVSSLRDAVKEGKSLAEGLSNNPSVFDNIYIQLVRAGEASGKLELILERLTAYLERQLALRKKIRGALRYPMIQLGVITLVVTVLLTFVVPQMTEAFAESNAALPWTTQLLVSLSYFLTHHYILLLGTLAALFAGFKFFKSTPQGKYILDVIKLKIPIVSYFARMGAIVQFSRTLGMLLEAGVNLSEALDIVCRIVDNQVLVNELNKARENIIKQGRVAEYLKRTGIFPPVAIYLINTGEQSGQLGQMLVTVAETYASETTEYADNLASKIDPIMLIVMAVIVGFILISILTPMMQMTELISE